MSIYPSFQYSQSVKLCAILLSNNNFILVFDWLVSFTFFDWSNSCITLACVARCSSQSRREKWAARRMGRREGKGMPAMKPAFFEVYYSCLQLPEATYFYWLKHNYMWKLKKNPYLLHKEINESPVYFKHFWTIVPPPQHLPVYLYLLLASK